MDFTALDDARLDLRRHERTGVPEVVYAEHKTLDQIETILHSLYEANGFALATRVPHDVYDELLRRMPDAVGSKRARALRRGRAPKTNATVGVVCAGTSDLPVADEAAFVAETLGHDVVRLTDVGVAGIHRLLHDLPRLEACGAVVVVAGMEGTLPGIVAGLTRAPVIAVPTSVGYGVAAGGTAALHTMLASCAPGIGVVNVDNGFGAAALAHKIVMTAKRP